VKWSKPLHVVRSAEGATPTPCLGVKDRHPPFVEFEMPRVGFPSAPLKRRADAGLAWGGRGALGPWAEEAIVR
jgi:hypothetical protein